MPHPVHVFKQSLRNSGWRADRTGLISGFRDPAELKDANVRRRGCPDRVI
jgi:hypothetical protein